MNADLKWIKTADYEGPDRRVSFNCQAHGAAERMDRGKADEIFREGDSAAFKSAVERIMHSS